MKLKTMTIGLAVAVAYWLYSVYTVGTTGTVGTKPAEQDAAMLRNHCEMVALFNATGGEFGWPDYNGTAHLCPTPPAVPAPATAGSNQRVEP